MRWLLILPVASVLALKQCKDLISKCPELKNLCFKADSFHLIGDAKVEKVCPKTCGTCDDSDARNGDKQSFSFLLNKAVSDN